ncbi:MAG: hypothetical protein NTW54_08140 [Bacteroidetes bacterium]|nr:hypothetical protein [Bacteroidota bacterium]
MIRKYFILLIPAFLIAFTFIKCRKESLVSPIPTISFLGYEKISYKGFNQDSLLFLRIHFEDGDGDIGLSITDTAAPFRIGDRYYYNVFASYQAGKNGNYEYLINGADTVSYNDRINNLQPETRNKGITGTITLKLEPIIGALLPDSIKLNIYIVDRALNTSNTITTGAIPVSF